MSNGPAIQIQDRWKCQDSMCSNYSYVCWLLIILSSLNSSFSFGSSFSFSSSLQAKAILRFTNYLPVKGSIIFMQAREVTLGRSTISEPSNTIQLAIVKSQKAATAKKRSRNTEPTIRNLVKILVANIVSQQSSRVGPFRVSVSSAQPTEESLPVTPTLLLALASSPTSA